MVSVFIEIASVVPVVLALLVLIYVIIIYRTQPSFASTSLRKIQFYIWRIEFTAKSHNYYLKQIRLVIAILFILEVILLLLG